MPSSHDISSKNSSSHIEKVVTYSVLALFLCLHLSMVWLFEINWDEFFRLARIYEWKAGTLTAIFESNYVHGFHWLKHVHANEIYQIIAGRAVMFLLLLYSSFLIFRIISHFLNNHTAALTLIAFLSFSFVFRHATSFRIDLPIISLLLSTIWLITCSKKEYSHFLLAGLCLGLAGSISIKSVFYVPTLAVLLLIHWWGTAWRLKGFLQGLIMGGTSLISVVIFLYLHSLTLTEAESATGFISYASNAAILGYGIFPQRTTAIAGLVQNPLYFAFFILGFGIALHHLIKGHERTRSLVFLCALLPLTSLIVYVHTYVYFYTFLLATASFIVGLGIYGFLQKYPRLGLYLPIAFLVTSAATIFQSFKQTNHYQRQVNQVVHTMFDIPVNYIDRTSQISSFPKQGLFMTAVQVDEYKMRGTPVMQNVFDKTPPQFLLANIASLDLDKVRETNPSRRLMNVDETLLIENFIHHWGPIYVPGHNLKGPHTRQSLRIALPGIYTIEAESDVIINGRTYAPQQIVQLPKDEIQIDLLTNETLTLRWGKRLYKPDASPLGDVVFRGF